MFELALKEVLEIESFVKYVSTMVNTLVTELKRVSTMKDKLASASSEAWVTGRVSANLQRILIVSRPVNFSVASVSEESCPASPES